MNKKIIGLICTVGIVFSPIHSYAEDTKSINILDAVITKNAISPTSDFYFLDRIAEHFIGEITFDNYDKINYKLNLAKERLSELYYDKSINLQQQKQLLQQSNDSIKEAVDILPDLLKSNAVHKKEMLDITYNIVYSFSDISLKILKDKHLEESNFTEQLAAINENSKIYVTKITSLKIESGLYNNSALVDGLIILPTSNAEINKQKYVVDVEGVVPKLKNKNDQDKVEMLKNELNGLFDYIIKQTRQEFDVILAKEVKADAKILLINSTIEIANNQMNEIYNIKKQQLDEIVSKTNTTVDSSNKNLKITSIEDKTTSGTKTKRN